MARTLRFSRSLLIALVAIGAVAALASHGAGAGAPEVALERSAAPTTTEPAPVPTTSVVPPPPTTVPSPTTNPTTAPTAAPVHRHTHEHDQAPTAVSAPAPASVQVTPPPGAGVGAPAGRAADESEAEYLERAFLLAVPDLWRADIEVTLEVIPGRTSWAHGDGRIQISEEHARADVDHLGDVIAHEFGHLIAFEYGTREYAGAGPEGWPAPADKPEEAWADCVQTAFTGRDRPSHGLASCSGESLQWAIAWLAGGPPAA